MILYSCGPIIAVRREVGRFNIELSTKIGKRITIDHRGMWVYAIEWAELKTKQKSSATWCKAGEARVELHGLIDPILYLTRRIRRTCIICSLS